MPVRSAVDGLFKMQALSDNAMPVRKIGPMPCEQCRVFQGQTRCGFADRCNESLLLIWCSLDGLVGKYLPKGGVNIPERI